jgi:hypothetical protein
MPGPNKNKTAILDAQSGPSGRGTDHGYGFEVRVNLHEPVRIGELLLDNRWKRIYTEARFDGFGVPAPKYRCTAQQIANLLTRTEAEAHRWYFVAMAEAQDGYQGSLGLETRIVKYKVVYSFEVTPVEYLDAFDGRGDLPEDMATTTETETELKDNQ